MKLYFSPGACSLAAHIMLEETGLKYEGVRVNLANKTDEFLAVNPKGYVPVLVTDKNDVLTEDAVILQYLADQKPEMNLLPKAGTWERYKAMETLNFIATELHKGFGPLWHLKEAVPNAEGMEQLRQYTITKLAKRFDNLTDQMKGRDFVFGDRFTACDAYAFTILNWSRYLKVDMSRWPALMGFMERVQARPSVQAAMKNEGILK